MTIYRYEYTFDTNQADVAIQKVIISIDAINRDVADKIAETMCPADSFDLVDVEIYCEIETDE